MSEGRSPLKVGVLVDLALQRGAGGHVKFWRRIAEAAVELADANPDRLDLTVHFIGKEPRQIALSPAVRYRLLPPVLSTARLVGDMPDDTDLAPWHPKLARVLGDYDVIHTTDAFFCYARTATLVGRRRGIPVVSSIHTNTPEYARITTAKLLQRLLGDGLTYQAANDVLRLPVRVKRLLERRLHRHLGRVAAAMGGAGAPLDAGPADRAGGLLLRRGVDRARFAPERRDRGWFERRFALPAGHLILMYAGKLDAGKNVPLLAPIVARVRQMGLPVQLFCAGSGVERATLAAALGPALTCAGTLDQHELARAYASADLFLFPSAIDEMGNAAIEALACGLPALVAAGSGVATRMADCPGLHVLPGDDPAPWAGAIADLAACPEQRAAMAGAARAYVEAQVPSWREVLAEDLLPVWRAAAGRSA